MSDMRNIREKVRANTRCMCWFFWCLRTLINKFPAPQANIHAGCRAAIFIIKDYLYILISYLKPLKILPT